MSKKITTGNLQQIKHTEKLARSKSKPSINPDGFYYFVMYRVIKGYHFPLSTWSTLIADRNRDIHDRGFITSDDVSRAIAQHKRSMPELGELSRLMTFGEVPNSSQIDKSLSFLADWFEVPHSQR